MLRAGVWGGGVGRKEGPGGAQELDREPASLWGLGSLGQPAIHRKYNIRYKVLLLKMFHLKVK